MYTSIKQLSPFGLPLLEKKGLGYMSIVDHSVQSIPDFKIKVYKKGKDRTIKKKEEIII